MLEFLILSMLSVSVGVILWFVAKLIQLSKFGDAMTREIDTAYAKNWRAGESLDVHTSYDNLDRSWPWDYNFEKMIVYARMKG